MATPDPSSLNFRLRHFGLTTEIIRFKEIIDIFGNWTGFILYFSLLLTIVLLINSYNFNWFYQDDIGLVDFYREWPANPAYKLVNVLFVDNGFGHIVGMFLFIIYAIFWIVGVNFSAIVLVSIALGVLTSGILCLSVVSTLKKSISRVFLWSVLTILFFHPLQVGHFLWPFELSWFIVNFILVLNSCILERWPRGLSIGIIIVGSTLASLSSAQGVLLWLVASVHALLNKDLPGRYIYSAGLIVGFIAFLKVLPSIEIFAVSIPHMSQYYVTVFGSLFAVRHETLALVLGVCVLVIPLVFAASLISETLSVGPTQRISGILILGSLLFVAGFTLGRYRYGLEWYFHHFHAAPLFAPFLAGIGILSITSFDQLSQSNNTYRYTYLIPLLFILSSSICAIPYAKLRANELLILKSYGMAVSCTGSPSIATLGRANGLPNWGGKIHQNLQLLRHLCTDKIPPQTKQLKNLPPLFRELAGRDASYAAPLRDLWDAYATEASELQRLLPIEDPKTPARLLNLARKGAKSGPPFPLGLLSTDTVEFLKSR